MRKGRKGTVAIPAELDREQGARPAGIHADKKTILIYSPDLNFSFSLSMVFQDRYNVVTTSNPTMLESFASTYNADLAIVDAVPSDRIMQQIDGLKALRGKLPVIMTYVYDAREVRLDSAARVHTDAVLYKPFEADSVLSQVECLLSV